MDLGTGVALIILLGVLPGIPADFLFRFLSTDFWRMEWGNQQWQVAIRYVMFSAFGLMLCVLVAFVLGFCWNVPQPIHIQPAVLSTLNEERLPSIMLSYFFHWLGAITSALFLVWVFRRIVSERFAEATTSAWDYFADNYMDKRWLTVRLKSGALYTGSYAFVEIDARRGKRSLILEDPCIYREGNYFGTGAKYLLLGSDAVAEIQANANSEDTLLRKIGEPLYEEDKSNDKKPRSIFSGKRKGKN